MTPQDTQTLIDFCLQQQAANTRLMAHMPSANSAAHFQVMAVWYTAIMARLAEADDIELARNVAQAELARVTGQLQQVTTERDAAQTALQSTTEHATALTARLQALVEDSSHYVEGAAGVPLGVVAVGPAVIGRRRCQIRDHRKQIRSLQRALAFAQSQLVESRRCMQAALTQLTTLQNRRFEMELTNSTLTAQAETRQLRWKQLPVWRQRVAAWALGDQP